MYLINNNNNILFKIIYLNAARHAILVFSTVLKGVHATQSGRDVRKPTDMTSQQLTNQNIRFFTQIGYDEILNGTVELMNSNAPHE